MKGTQNTNTAKQTDIPKRSKVKDKMQETHMEVMSAISWGVEDVFDVSIDIIF